MSGSGITEAFAEFGSDIGESLRQEWKKRLLDDKVEYKHSILLTLRRQYPNLADAEKAGFTTEMLKHAVSVLRANGYFVDLGQGVIQKEGNC